MRVLYELARDERGVTAPNFLSQAVTWFVTFVVFLLNVLLGQLFYCRDCVDHGASLAAKAAKDSYCAKGESSAAAEQAAKKSIGPVMATMGDQTCQVSVRPDGSGEDPGAQPLQVGLNCQVSCKVPLACQILHRRGKISLSAQRKTVSTGCDGKESGT